MVACLLACEGVAPEFVHGKTMYVHGPSAGGPPFGTGQDARDSQIHTWIEILNLGIIDLSPNLVAAQPQWRNVPFNGICAGRWVPLDRGSVVVCSDLREFDAQVAFASRAADHVRALYVSRSRETLSPSIIISAIEYINSPLTEKLGVPFDEGIYAKAVLHLRDRLLGKGRSLAGLSQNKAWAIVASREGDATREVLRKLGWTSVPRLGLN